MAKLFRFRFETLLKIRRQREDHHKRVVADRLRQIQQVKDKLVSLARLIGDETDAMRIGQQSRKIDMQQTVRHRGWIMHLQKATLEAEAQQRGLEAQLVQERSALAEAAKQCRILEKLKERQWDRHHREEERLETLAADDLNTVRYVFDRVEAKDAVDEVFTGQW